MDDATAKYEGLDMLKPTTSGKISDLQVSEISPATRPRHSAEFFGACDIKKEEWQNTGESRKRERCSQNFGKSVINITDDSDSSLDFDVRYTFGVVCA